VHAALRYVIATLLAVLGGFIGFHLPLKHEVSLAGSELLVAGLLGFIAGAARTTGFLGNVINAFFVSPILLLLPGVYAVIAGWWFWGNLGYAAGNVLGQIARLASEEKIGVRSL
jgi:uncharacterized membrane protein (UPF0136 family)